MKALLLLSVVFIGGCGVSDFRKHPSSSETEYNFSNRARGEAHKLGIDRPVKGGKLVDYSSGLLYFQVDGVVPPNSIACKRCSVHYAGVLVDKGRSFVTVDVQSNLYHRWPDRLTVEIGNGKELQLVKGSDADEPVGVYGLPDQKRIEPSARLKPNALDWSFAKPADALLKSGYVYRRDLYQGGHWLGSLFADPPKNGRKIVLGNKQ